MKRAELTSALSGLLSRFFPKTADIDLKVDISEDANVMYFEPRVSYRGSAHTFVDLASIPTRIKIGSRYFRISQKNRQTLRKLTEWDPVFEPKRGFAFHEKDVPEVLSYLRSKGSTDLTPAARNLVVDPRPLEYVHFAQEKNEEVQVQTGLSDLDFRVVISDTESTRSTPGSEFLHSKEGYFKKPRPHAYQTLNGEIGTQNLTGDQIPLFLLYDLKKLLSDGRSVVRDGLQDKTVVTGQFEPKVSVDVDGPWIWLDVRYQADRFQIPFHKVETQLKQAQFLKEDKDTWVQIDKKAHQSLKQEIEKVPEIEQEGESFRAPTRRFQEVQALLDKVSGIDASEAFQKFIESLRNFTSIEDRPLPATLRGDPLRDYQKHGYNWLCFLSKYGLNGILADEMGLGKTVQTLSALLDSHSYVDVPCSLIVCPPSVLSAWEDDIRRFTSATDFRVTRFVGSNRERVLKNVEQYNAILTTYTTATRDMDALSKIVWNYVVLDEAQKIKNYETATAKCCKRLVAHHKVALTGTPIENRLSELWSIFDFLMPSYFGTVGSFRDEYEIPIVKRGDKQSTERLKKKMSPFKLRRLKAQVASELPEKIPMDRYCELLPEQVKLYRQYAANESERIRAIPEKTIRVDTSILTAILRLKQICCHPALILDDYEQIHGRSGKLEAFVEILEELLENKEKALIFSQFTGMLRILRQILAERGIDHFYLDGQTPEKERARLKSDFQKGLVPFFLISLRAGGLGMTLTEANCVVHYDRWWNPAVEDQATDRVHRLGQDKPVKVFRIHTVGTIEERIGQLLVKKKDLFDAVIDVDDLKKEVSKEELLALFAPPKASAGS